jgi:hypothetical protein
VIILGELGEQGAAQVQYLRGSYGFSGRAFGTAVQGMKQILVFVVGLCKQRWADRGQRGAGKELESEGAPKAESRAVTLGEGALEE